MMTKSNIDGVIIITPTNSHKDITLSAIDKDSCFVENH